jgi:hypothetical protein
VPTGVAFETAAHDAVHLRRGGANSAGRIARGEVPSPIRKFGSADRANDDAPVLL